MKKPVVKKNDQKQAEEKPTPDVLTGGAQQPQSEEKKEAPKPPTVKELVVAAIEDLPELNDLKSSISNIITIQSLYIGSEEMPVPVKVSRETALMELELSQNMTKDTIDGDLNNTMKGIAGVIQTLEDDFNKKSGAKVEKTDFDGFKIRFEQEKNEQQKLKEKAFKLLKNVQNVAGQLGVANPDPGVKKTSAKKPNVLTKIAGVFFEPKEEAVSNPEKPGWLTEALISENDKNLQLLKVIQANLESGADVSLVWIKLQGLKMSENKVTEILFNVADISRSQIAQSEEILTNVTPEFEEIQKKLSAIMNLTAIVKSVKKFIS